MHRYHSTWVFTHLLTLFMLHANSSPFEKENRDITIPLPEELVDRCVDLPSWNPPLIDIAGDCEAALRNFEDEIDEYGPDPGTFYYIGASPITTARSWAIFPAASQQERKIMQLPKRYTEGSCTVAIVMMKAFRELPSFKRKEFILPGVDPNVRYAGEDELRLHDAVQDIGHVRATCQNACGYVIVGKQRSVAVAIWQRASVWDALLEGMMGVVDTNSTSMLQESSIA